MRHFCTAGPIKTDIHYYIPPLDRMNRAGLFDLIDQQKYFILHAPRQTGKTSCLLALVEELNKTGRYRAAYVNIEGAQAARQRVDAAIKAILSALAGSARFDLKDPYPDQIRDAALARSGGEDALRDLLQSWSENSPLPLCLMIDEIDALIGDTLIAVLRQLRAGYPRRPMGFPQSIVLCGVRDVRDYSTGGGGFNIKAASLRLGDFTRDEVRQLYGQHTSETGQRFDEDVFPVVWELTRGQPWLVNALAYEVCFRVRENRDDRTRVITASIIQQAKANMILRRETHLDHLTGKLKEPRVEAVIDSILTGDAPPINGEFGDDTQYVIDLGLIRRTESGLEVANAIYREVIRRRLNYCAQT